MTILDLGIRIQNVPTSTHFSFGKKNKIKPENKQTKNDNNK